jgi:hypothetical protein
VRQLLVAIVILCAQNVCAQTPPPISFDHDEVGKFPSCWASNDQKNMIKIYSVQAEGQDKFLHADAIDLSVQISYRGKWDITDYPVLRWRWRAVLFPTGSNEQIKSGGDSVLGLYVVFGGKPFVTAIKYVWSDTLPGGMAFDSPYSNGTKIIVVRGGREAEGNWVSEERNLLSDCERFFKIEKKCLVAQAIAILTDSDNTHSRAVGDYAHINIGR